jgi:hypothetical protein
MTLTRESVEAAMPAWEASVAGVLEDGPIVLKRRFDEDGDETDEDFTFDDDDEEDEDSEEFDDEEDFDDDDDEDYDDFSFDDEDEDA